MDFLLHLHKSKTNINENFRGFNYPDTLYK